MRHRYAATLLLAALLALAGCGGGGDTADAKPSPSKTVSKADRFLKAVHAANLTSWKDTGPTDVELLLYPQKWCDGLDQGHSVKWLFDITGGGGLYPVGEDWGTYEAEADEVLVMGVKAYCPGNLDAVRQELRESGEY